MADKTGGRGQTLQVCVTPQSSDLTLVQFAALTYIDVCCLQDTTEFASTANIVSETCISGEKIRLVGADEDSDLEVTWFYDSACAGQNSLRTFGLAKSNVAYAFRKVYADGVAGVRTPTTLYIRAIVSGYTDSGIGIDDVQTQSISGSIVQGPLFVGPAPI